MIRPILETCTPDNKFTLDELEEWGAEIVQYHPEIVVLLGEVEIVDA